MVITVSKLVDSCTTNAQGQVVYDAISFELALGSQVVVDFGGIDYATTSFVNSAIVALQERIGYSQLKQRVKLINVNRQLGDMIKRRTLKVAA